MRFLIATLLAAQLGACSSHKDAPAASGSAVPTTRAAAAPSAPADNIACKLASADDAAKLLGHPVKAGEPRVTGPLQSCRYGGEAGGTSVTVQYFEHGDRDFDSMRSAMVKEPVEISGAGTKAVRNADGSVLIVLANGHVGIVLAMALGKNAGPTAAAAEAFAPVLASRL